MCDRGVCITRKCGDGGGGGLWQGCECITKRCGDGGGGGCCGWVVCDRQTDDRENITSHNFVFGW